LPLRREGDWHFGGSVGRTTLHWQKFRLVLEGEQLLAALTFGFMTLCSRANELVLLLACEFSDPLDWSCLERRCRDVGVRSDDLSLQTHSTSDHRRCHTLPATEATRSPATASETIPSLPQYPIHERIRLRSLFPAREGEPAPRKFKVVQSQHDKHALQSTAPRLVCLVCLLARSDR
jgi:hypothetical protein